MYIAHLTCLKHLFKNILLKAILWILYKIEIDHCWWQFTFIHVVFDYIWGEVKINKIELSCLTSCIICTRTSPTISQKYKEMTKGWENRENDYDPKISHWDGTPYLQHGGALDSFVGWITLLSSVKQKSEYRH
jgi:hypothetical protein